MKKLFLLFSLCLLPFSLKANCTWLEFKASYYHFDSLRVREIVGNGAAFVQGEINYTLDYDVVLFADAGYLSTKGQSLNFNQRTRLEAVPFTFGAKYNFPLGCGSVYLGGGVRGFAVHIEDDSNFVQPFIRKTSVGGVINTGFNICYKNFILNPFFEYNFIHLLFDRNTVDVERNIYRHDVNLSGFAIGAGIGYVY